MDGWGGLLKSDFAILFIFVGEFAWQIKWDSLFYIIPIMGKMILGVWGGRDGGVVTVVLRFVDNSVNVFISHGNRWQEFGNKHYLI